MRRTAACLLLVWFAALGTGAAPYLHDLQHRHDDALAAAEAEHHSHPAPEAPRHNESNCPTHALLAAPIALTTFAVTVAAPTISDINPPADAACVGSIHTDHFDRRGPPA